MHRTNERSLGDIIKEVLRTHRLEDKVIETRIHSSWEKIMGTHVARYTDRLVLKGGRLTIYVGSPALRTELTYARTKIIEMINSEMGPGVISELHIR